MAVFRAVDTAIKFAENETKILAFWKEHKIFEKSLRAREDVKDTRTWVFYEGPPTANGKPHPGHVLTRVVKDLFPRYKTMCGYYVPRKAGWDTHGLPVEIEVEKELKLDGKADIIKYGIEPFVRKCMDSVFRYTQDWENLTEKIAFWIDLKDAYVTYHKEYVESVWWSLKELHAQNLLYRGHKILPWCPHCQTALSSHEVGLGYQEVEDPSVFVTFRDVDWETNKTSFLAWTTTPWTLPSNAGLAVKADTEYSYVKIGDETLIMASALVKQALGKLKYEVVKTEQGSALVGRRYQPLFDWWRPVPPASRRPEQGKNVPKSNLIQGRHYRGYLPHFKVEGATYFVTFRTAGSLPKHVYESLALEVKQELARNPSLEMEVLLNAKLDAYLDNGNENAWLKNHDAAEIVENALKHFNGDRYDLHAWAVMPNHVHVVVTPNQPHTLSQILHSWKSFTAHKLKDLLKLDEAAFWQHESYDHVIRSDDEFLRCCEYVINNPAKAGMVDWKYCGGDWERTPGAETGRRDAGDTGAWKVCAADFVTLDTGSGIVHVAPAFGADDYELGKKEGLPVIQLVGPDGKFVEGCGDFTGRFCKEADADLIRNLKERKLLLKRENYKHDYPFCWRCKNPLIYFARGGWFIRTTREIAHVIENNQKVDWHPEHIKNGRFGSFLESNIDWALSRERYWGTPLPIWRNDDTGEEDAIGSLEELKAKPGVTGLDAFDKAKAADPTLNEHLRVHKPWIDDVTYLSQKGSRMKRVSEVIDCWYDSGAMPFAQWGYPHAPGSKERFNRAFPADFISEAIDQTRGWFYSLIAESTLLRDSFVRTSGCTSEYPLPYKTCLVLGHIGDEFGKKISKSNPDHRTPKYDPNAILNEEGADALRWFFYASNAPWNNARFSRPAVRETQKEFILKLRNVFSFFTIYANIDGFDPNDIENANQGKTELDKWIISELHSTIATVRACLDGYDILGAATALNAFVDSLSNWHVRRSRERFWAPWQNAARNGPRDVEKWSAYWTLYECLVTVAQLSAPFIPFMAEEIWQALAREPLGEDVPESVHLCDYPESDPSLIDAVLAKEIELVREAASLGRAARAGAKLKTRQPLAKVAVVLAKEEQEAIVRRHEAVLLDELNVKTIMTVARADDYVTYEVKPNFKAIGAKFRESVPLIKDALSKSDAASLRQQFMAQGKAIVKLGDGKDVELTTAEIEITLKAKEGFAAASGSHIVVVLDTHLTPELLDEGVARELVNRVNGWRSELKLAYEQRIRLAVSSSPKINAIALKFADYIGRETLSMDVVAGTIPPGYQMLGESIDDEKVELGLMLAE